MAVDRLFDEFSMQFFKGHAIIGWVENAVVEIRSDARVKFGTQCFFHGTRATVERDRRKRWVGRAERRGKELGAEEGEMVTNG